MSGNERAESFEWSALQAVQGFLQRKHHGQGRPAYLPICGAIGVP